MNSDQLRVRLREELDALTQVLDGAGTVEETLCHVEDAFGLAYPDGTLPDHGYQPAEARIAIDALAKQVHEYNKDIAARATALTQFAEQVKTAKDPQ